MRNKPILKDHNNSIDSIIGRTTQNVSYNSNDKKIDFEARIVDEDVKKKISQGLVTSVSIGAMVEDIIPIHNEDGETIAHECRGIDFVELSLVAVPADPGAGIGMALSEAFNLKQQQEKILVVNNKQTQKEEVSMTKTEKETNVSVVNEELKKLQEEKLALEISLEKSKVEMLKTEMASIEAKKVAETLRIEAEKLEETKKLEEAKIAEAKKLEEAKTVQITKGKINSDVKTKQNWNNFVLSKDNDIKHEGLTINSYKGMGLNRLGGF